MVTKTRIEYSKVAVHARQSPTFANMSSDELSALFAHKDERLSKIFESLPEQLVAKISATNPPTYVTLAMLEQIFDGVAEEINKQRRQDRAKASDLTNRVNALEDTVQELEQRINALESKS